MHLTVTSHYLSKYSLYLAKRLFLSERSFDRVLKPFFDKNSQIHLDGCYTACTIGFTRGTNNHIAKVLSEKVPGRVSGFPGQGIGNALRIPGTDIGDGNVISSVTPFQRWYINGNEVLAPQTQVVVDSINSASNAFLKSFGSSPNLHMVFAQPGGTFIRCEKRRFFSVWCICSFFGIEFIHHE